MELKKITDVYIIWKETKRQLVKESTLATYMTNAEKHILPAFGNCTKVEDSAAQAFAFGLLERGLSPRTVKDIMLVLKMIVVFGYRKGWLEWHEWDIRLPKDDVHNELKILTHSEQKTMMNFLGSHFSFRNLGLYICLCTGMRIGEICALKWCDIDLDTRMISVNRTIERIYVVDGGQRATKVVIGRPKTASSRREIPINNSLLRILRPLSRFICPDGYVLTNSEKPLEPRIYRRYYKLLMERLDMPRIKFHGLRHTFATRCIESQCDYKTVSSILDHSNISTTLNLYVHPDMGQKRKCIDKMMKSVMK